MSLALLLDWLLAASVGIRALLADASITLEGPTSLELTLIGGSLLAMYAVASRAL